MSFGVRLREIREQAGLTQKRLAEMLGVTQQGIGHWETGIREPGWSEVVALATALNVDCTAFATATAATTPPPAPPRRGRPRKTPPDATEPPPSAEPIADEDAAEPKAKGRRSGGAKGRRKA